MVATVPVQLEVPGQNGSDGSGFRILFGPCAPPYFLDVGVQSVSDSVFVVMAVFPSLCPSFLGVQRPAICVGSPSL